MFGRRKREEEAAAEAAREAERRALFERLAQRPENICPFLGLAGERAGYVEGISDEHRCFAFGDPTPLSAEQQTRVCQERGYGNCPRYLRGVLVIPTEELEALRRPRPAIAAPPPPPAPAVPQRERRRGSPIMLLLAAIVLLVGGVGAYFVFGRDNGTAVLPSPTASVTAETTPSPTEGSSDQPTDAASAAPTPVVLPSSGATIPPLPTPQPDSTFTGWVLAVTAGQYPVIRMSEDGQPGEQTEGIFDRVSGTPVDRVEVDGTTYWVTLRGGYIGLAYVSGLSGDFRVYETWEASDGSTGFVRLAEDDL